MDDRTQTVRWLGLLAVLAGSLYLCWRMAQPFIAVLLWSSVMAILFFPVQRRLTARTHSPGLSALATMLLVVVAVIVPLILTGAAVANEFTDLASSGQTQIATAIKDFSSGERLRQFTEKVKPYVDIDELASPEKIKEFLTSASQRFAAGTASVIGGILGVIVNAVLVLFTLYYLFRDGEKIASRLPDIIPLERAKSLAILARTRDIIFASVLGVLVIAVIQGILAGLMFWWLGLPSPLVWGLVMTLLSTIPVGGSAIVWLPAAIILVATGHWGKALILLAWCGIFVGSVDNLLRPRLVGKKTNLHELFIFFSVLGGLQVFGILGLLIGPVVVAITFALIEVLAGEVPASTAPSATSD